MAEAAHRFVSLGDAVSPALGLASPINNISTTAEQSWHATLAQDIRYGARSFARNLDLYRRRHPHVGAWHRREQSTR